MKIVALLLLGLTLGGCVTATPGDKAYGACLDTVPEDVRRAAEGEVDVFETGAQTASIQSNQVTSINTIASQPQCSEACQVAREEKHRIVSECYAQWQKLHPDLGSETEEVSDR